MYEAVTRRVPFEHLAQGNLNMGLFQVLLLLRYIVLPCGTCRLHVRVRRYAVRARLCVRRGRGVAAGSPRSTLKFESVPATAFSSFAGRALQLRCRSG